MFYPCPLCFLPLYPHNSRLTAARGGATRLPPLYMHVKKRPWCFGILHVNNMGAFAARRAKGRVRRAWGKGIFIAAMAVSRIIFSLKVGYIHYSSHAMMSHAEPLYINLMGLSNWLSVCPTSFMSVLDTTLLQTRCPIKQQSINISSSNVLKEVIEQHRNSNMFFFFSLM